MIDDFKSSLTEHVFSQTFSTQIQFQQYKSTNSPANTLFLAKIDDVSRHNPPQNPQDILFKKHSFPNT
ncbi:MAG: hypothetical protein CL920_00965 [Deltaproteobacteria bacterium]|nr:hypothetical protein [Deltaproteobacteria bacterium]